MDAHIHLSVDPNAPYKAVSGALVSLRDAGFTVKMGTVNVQPK